MDKINIVVSCPIDTYSGYGARSRDVIKSLLATNKYNVKVLSQRWGNTRFGYLADHKEGDLQKCIVSRLDGKPDVWIQITVPNEFQPIGKYNIGMTAGIETTVASVPWIEGCNRMDLILTSSEHSKKVFQATNYDKQDKSGNKLGALKLDKPIEVLLEGADIDKYCKKKTSSFDLSAIEEQFCFLFVGHWLQGEFGQDRKNIGWMVKTFLTTFKNKQNMPALILKTTIGNSTIISKDTVMRRVDQIRKEVGGKVPNVYLVDGDITDEDMNELYNHPKVKSMISFTKGEGFGRPLLEFALTGKPIIASGWSGHTDFLDKESSLLVGGTLEQLHPSAVQKDILIPEAKWFSPDGVEATRALKDMFKNYKKFFTLSRSRAYVLKKEFSMETMTASLDKILQDRLPEFPKQVPLNMPTLNLPELQ